VIEFFGGPERVIQLIVPMLGKDRLREILEALPDE
jgi:hypothetical protein